MSTDHEILVNQDEVLDILCFYGLLNCVATEEFIVSAIKALGKCKDIKAIFLLIAADLLDRYNVLETKKKGRTYRLYGHDEDGEEHLLLIKLLSAQSLS